MKIKYVLMCKIDSQEYPEVRFRCQKGEYDSKEEALSYAMKQAEEERLIAFYEKRMFPNKLPTIQKTEDSIYLTISEVGEKYGNITITYYVQEK